MVQHMGPYLLSLTEQSEGMTWIFMKNLRVGDVLEVQTPDTIYDMKVIDPEKGKVLVKSSGRHNREETEAVVIGSSLTGTGTLVKLRGIAFGLRLCLYVKSVDELLLSATQEVRVNGTKVLPAEITSWEDEVEGLEALDDLQ